MSSTSIYSNIKCMYGVVLNFSVKRNFSIFVFCIQIGQAHNAFTIDSFCFITRQSFDLRLIDFCCSLCYVIMFYILPTRIRDVEDLCHLCCEIEMILDMHQYRTQHSWTEQNRAEQSSVIHNNSMRTAVGCRT